MHRTLTRFGLLLALPVALLLSGCDRHDHDHGHQDMARVVIETRGVNPEVVAEWTFAGGWNQNELPPLSLSGANFGRASYTVKIFNSDGEQIEMGTVQRNEDGSRICTEFSARYSVQGGDVVHQPGDDGFVTVSGQRFNVFHCDHIHIYPRARGTASIDIVLWHVDHADARTTRIPIRVID